MSAASPVRRYIADALAEAREARALADAATKACDRAVAALLEAGEATLKRGVEDLPEDLPPPNEHRRQHRPGVVAKLDRDPEVRAFVEARLDRMTFAEIAAAVAERFPPSRCVRKSAIHAWFRGRRRRCT